MRHIELPRSLLSVDQAANAQVTILEPSQDSESSGISSVIERFEPTIKSKQHAILSANVLSANGYLHVKLLLILSLADLVYMQESAKESKEVENLHSFRMLQLAHASRDAFAASVWYHRLRLKELEIMRTIATDRCDQAKVWLKQADWQIGEIKHILDRDRTGLHEPEDLMLGLSGRAFW
ncbi:hypothetical protein HD554DRAFT_2172292 [Boletus coccyginus]|nr:hypothetical protein HD554DRAFT_2172292 [Boletus coccyginus]